MKMIHIGLALVASLALLTPGAYAADADADAIAKTPKAVLDTVNKKFPDAKITDSAKETAEGVVMYKIALTDSTGAKHALVVGEDGKILADKNKATGQTTQGGVAK